MNPVTFIFVGLLLIEFLFFPFVIYKEIRAAMKYKKCRALRIYTLIFATTALLGQLIH